MTSGMTNMEKVTISVPSDLKKQVLSLKDELHTSISSIYKEAIEEYLKQKELQKWRTASTMASNDKEYMKFVKEISDSLDDIVEPIFRIQ